MPRANLNTTARHFSTDDGSHRDRVHENHVRRYHGISTKPVAGVVDYENAEGEPHRTGTTDLPESEEREGEPVPPEVRKYAVRVGADDVEYDSQDLGRITLHFMEDTRLFNYPDGYEVSSVQWSKGTFVTVHLRPER